MMEENNNVENATKAAMPKYVWGLITLIVVLLIATFTIQRKSNEKLAVVQQDYYDLQDEQLKKDSVMNAMEDVFDEIQYNLIFVQEKRGQLYIDYQEGKKDPRRQIVDDVKLMDRILHESETQIKELQEKLAKEGMAIPAYERRIKALQETIRQQNADIIDLQQVVAVQNFKLSDLQSKVEVMDKRLSLQRDSIAMQVELLKVSERKLHLGYVAYGTTKELKSRNLITKEGAVLGIGGSNELTDDFDESYFMEVDMRDVAQISLHTKKAELITQHPSDSYHFEEKDGEVKFLSIDDPEEFWKISKFVVIKVK
ncbi:MAG: hypothetical protein ACK5JS_02555 [Mangrovibacterium sp.]